MAQLNVPLRTGSKDNAEVVMATPNRWPLNSYFQFCPRTKHGQIPGWPLGICVCEAQARDWLTVQSREVTSVQISRPCRLSRGLCLLPSFDGIRVWTERHHGRGGRAPLLADIGQLDASLAQSRATQPPRLHSSTRTHDR